MGGRVRIAVEFRTRVNGRGGQTEENDSGPRSVELLRPFLVTSAIRQRLPCDWQRVPIGKKTLLVEMIKGDLP